MIKLRVEGKIFEVSEDGCGNHGCAIVKPKGQATNGGCSCFNHIDKEYRLKVKKKYYGII